MIVFIGSVNGVAEYKHKGSVETNLYAILTWLSAEMVHGVRKKNAPYAFYRMRKNSPPISTAAIPTDSIFISVSRNDHILQRWTHKELNVVKLYTGRGVDVGHIAWIAETALHLACRHKELAGTREILG
ncbi:hypothetical protein BDV38DRAFT_256998 [Aspergillus pseudotamarii]|uniref:Uncharacterized protein n=1 Tax=Aspergillus pseudotamarii TaxID=132259 RepID=A0A5N6SL60_ASPPS|nr:uncharacterized protein BDV38DRAFT_256998 [Aspergillus pseudotamarii]KAE8133874.1 hypothetical protein BDV38DRAFT_256998 [Aspergillus pseudotamarii]